MCLCCVLPHPPKYGWAAPAAKTSELHGHRGKNCKQHTCTVLLLPHQTSVSLTPLGKPFFPAAFPPHQTTERKRRSLSSLNRSTPMERQQQEQEQANSDPDFSKQLNYVLLWYYNTGDDKPKLIQQIEIVNKTPSKTHKPTSKSSPASFASQINRPTPRNPRRRRRRAGGAGPRSSQPSQPL